MCSKHALWVYEITHKLQFSGGHKKQTNEQPTYNAMTAPSTTASAVAAKLKLALPALLLAAVVVLSDAVGVCAVTLASPTASGSRGTASSSMVSGSSSMAAVGSGVVGCGKRWMKQGRVDKVAGRCKRGQLVGFDGGRGQHHCLYTTLLLPHHSVCHQTMTAPCCAPATTHLCSS